MSYRRWDYTYDDPPSRAGMLGYVYALRKERGLRIKFGFSGDPEARARSLGTACAARVLVLASIRGTHSDEVRLHRALKPYQFYGEWYHPTRQILDIVTVMRDGVTIAALLEKAGAL